MQVSDIIHAQRIKCLFCEGLNAHTDIVCGFFTALRRNGYTAKLQDRTLVFGRLCSRSGFSVLSKCCREALKCKCGYTGQQKLACQFRIHFFLPKVRSYSWRWMTIRESGKEPVETSYQT